MRYIKFIFIVAVGIFIVGCGGVSSDKKNGNAITKVACVGDSITEGLLLANPSQESYPTQLSQILDRGWDVQNFGKESATVMRSGDLPYWETNAYIPSHDYAPDVVVIMLGTNDTRTENWVDRASFISYYTQLIETYKNLESQPIVYICYPPPVYEGGYDGITNTRVVNELLPLIAQTASDNGIEIIDIYTALSNKVSFFNDAIHPNVNGARVIAETVYQSIY